MSAGALRALGAALLPWIVLAGCGKKGDPLPPLQIVPARVADLTAFRSGDRIELQFTVPAGEPDGGTVVTPERIEIYRAVTPAEVSAPTAPQAIAAERNLRAEIDVRLPDEPAPAAPGVVAPAPGERATYVDAIDPADASGHWTYVAVGVIGRNRRGPASAVASVPLATLPEPPVSVTISNDEKAVQVSWTGSAPLYRVFRIDQGAAPAAAQVLTPKPIADARLVQPVEFGREQCFVVRSVQTTGAVTIEGPPSPVTCYTPVDRYPPPAPANLRVIQEGTAITLNWTPVNAPDLAGYVVLRGGMDGIDMQPLVREPVRDSTYRDETVTPGTTYTYSVYAVDNAPTPNVSQQSERQTVTVR